jgi:hypothetical protein
MSEVPLYIIRGAWQRATRRRDLVMQVDGNGSSNSHGARPVHLIITIIKWIRTSRLSIKNSLSGRQQVRYQIHKKLPLPVGTP